MANPKVDEFIRTAGKWKDEFIKLRAIALSCKVEEDLKWGVPCYSLQDKNIVLIHGFRDYCALLFFKGALMKDPAGILISQSENVQASRQIRFNGIEEITALESTLKKYIDQAIEIERSGMKVDFKATADFTVPEELNRKFACDEAFKTAFYSLTPGRQRAYILYFSQAKQDKTREARIEKNVGRIMEGKGLND